MGCLEEPSEDRLKEPSTLERQIGTYKVQKLHAEESDMAAQRYAQMHDLNFSRYEIRPSECCVSRILVTYFDTQVRP